MIHEKYVDIKIRKYKTNCCGSAFYGIVGNSEIKCIKCDADVSTEVTNEYERLMIEFEVKLKAYQQGYNLNKNYLINNIKDWDWTIEVGNKGFFFIQMQCIPVFGGGRYTMEETDLASEEFNKIDNPDIPRTQEEGRALIDKIRNKILNPPI